ncbi:hypothetical protein GPJ56_008134 [Histomonas meleagridis]|uniref:uncharacterized protein n=1 Tax=Histomonas meleagridis TaxID=135588 RepID=UPI00355A909D|nr:hypothetical protein GPJ56_008134 [Histomonas meleagridis]KAH0803126.1 hypothetical protein GO595_004219 [Histomonas meleagridis]
MNVIDLSLNTDSDDDITLLPKVKTLKLAEKSEKDEIFPAALTHNSLAQKDPFADPLIDSSRSLSYMFSFSSVDPLSNLLRHLNEASSESKALLSHMSQALSFGATSVDIFPMFYEIIFCSDSIDNYTKLLAIRAIYMLAINDINFCQIIFTRTPDFLAISEDGQFLIDILKLFQIVSTYSSKDDAKLIIEEFHLKQNLVHFKEIDELIEPVRSLVLSVYSEISKYGDIFPRDLVKDILNKCNYPGSNHVTPSIVYPSMLCTYSFLQQPETDAYAYVNENPNLLFGKVSLALIHLDAQKDIDLQILALKILLDTLNMYCGNIHNLNLYFQLLSALVGMKNSENKTIKKLAGSILMKFGIDSNNEAH